MASAWEAPDRLERGRLATRRAVRVLLKHSGETGFPGGYELVRKRNGRPTLAAPHGCPSLLVSLTHTGDTTFAYVGMREAGVSGIGIDVERRDRDHDGLWEGGFTGDERRVLAPVAREAGQARAALSAWCAKEAVVKALGTGFEGDPWATACVKATTNIFWFRSTDGRHTQAYTYLQGPWVFAFSHVSEERMNACRIPA